MQYIVLTIYYIYISSWKLLVCAFILAPFTFKGGMKQHILSFLGLFSPVQTLSIQTAIYLI
jgi:hypothetical protein